MVSPFCRSWWIWEIYVSKTNENHPWSRIWAGAIEGISSNYLSKYDKSYESLSGCKSKIKHSSQRSGQSESRRWGINKYTLKSWYNEPWYSDFCYIVNKTQLPFWGFTMHITFDIGNKKGLTKVLAISRFECMLISERNRNWEKCYFFSLLIF